MGKMKFLYNSFGYLSKAFLSICIISLAIKVCGCSARAMNVRWFFGRANVAVISSVERRSTETVMWEFNLF